MATTVDLSDEYMTLTTKLAFGCDNWLKAAQTFAETLTKQGLSLSRLEFETEWILRVLYISTMQMKLTSTPHGIIIETERQLRDSYAIVYEENADLKDERDTLRAELAALKEKSQPQEDMISAAAVTPVFKGLEKFCGLMEEQLLEVKKKVDAATK
ncbi:unnamed protein product [Penicillium manginii]